MHAHNLLEQASENKLGGAGMSWAKFRLLTDLQGGEAYDATEGLQPSELSDTQGVSCNTVSALIATLEKDGWIRRELHDTDHRHFDLSHSGRKQLKTKMGSQFIFVTQCFDTFRTAERRTFLEFLNRLNHSLVELNHWFERKYFLGV